MTKVSGIRQSGRIPRLNKFSNRPDEPLVIRDEGDMSSGDDFVEKRPSKIPESKHINKAKGIVSEKKDGKRKGPDVNPKEVKVLEKISKKKKRKVRVDEAETAGKKKSRSDNEKVKQHVTVNEVAEDVWVRIDKVFTTRSSPKPMWTCVRELTEEQVNEVKKIGFGSLLEFAVDAIPGRLAYAVLMHFDEDDFTIRFDEKSVTFNRESVRNVFGIPMGAMKFEEIKIAKDKPRASVEFYQSLREVYGKRSITTSDLLYMITGKRVTGWLFRMCFMMLFANSLCFTTRSGCVDSTVLSKLTEDTVIADIDWCSFMLQGLVGRKSACHQGDAFNNFSGALTLLVLVYCDRFSFGGFEVSRSWPVCRNWTNEKLKRRFAWEKIHGFGVGDLLPEVVEGADVEVNDGVGGEQEDDQSLQAYNKIVTSLIDELSVVVKKASDKFGDAFDVSLFKKRCKKIFRGKEKVSLNDSLRESSVLKTPSNAKFVGVPQNELFGSSSVNAFSVRSKQAENSMFQGVSLGISQLSQPVGGVGCALGEESVVEKVGSVERHDGLSGSLKVSGKSAVDNGKGVDAGIIEAGKELVPFVDAAPITGPVPVGGKEKRKPKMSRNVISPFKNRICDIRPVLNVNEKRITNFLYSHTKDKYDVVYESESTLRVMRFCMEIMSKDSDIQHVVIDAWAEVLNYEEQLRSKSSWSRFFGNTMYLTFYDIMNNVAEDVMYAKFELAIEKDLALHGVSAGLIGIDLFLLPIAQSHHFYLVVVNLKHPGVYILDNSDKKVDSLFEKYLGIPELVQRFVVRYMHTRWNPKDGLLVNVPIERWSMRCCTSDNHHDCGVFCMRHMETFKGETALSYNCGLHPEGKNQNAQLDKLRSRYATKILLADSNIHRDAFVKDALEFSRKYTDAEQGVQILKAVMTREERWNKG